MKKLLILMVALGVFALADPLNPINSRPYAGTLAPYPGEPGLNCIMGHDIGDCNGNTISPIWLSGAPDKLTDQSPFGMWTLNGGGNVATHPILKFEFTAGATSQVIGIFTSYDTAGPIYAWDIFTGSATGQTNGGEIGATLEFNTIAGTLDVYSSPTNCSNGKVNCTSGPTSGLGINPNFFGFYLKTGGATYYTADALNNGGQARALAYEGPGGRWALGFEDGSDWDFQDAVISTESIVGAVPEPGSIALLTTACVGIGLLLRRRKSALS